MDYIITIADDDEVACIETIAAQNKLTATQYLTNICLGWIHGQMRGKYIQAARLADLSELKAVLTPTVKKIEAAEALKAKGV